VEIIQITKINFTMYAASGNDVLDFKVNFKVTRKVRKGILGLQSTTDELVILNDGKNSFPARMF
jgi:hypothetical protein